MPIRLSPAHPLVWRTTDAVQFGVEQPALVLDRVDARRHFVLGLLQKGVSRPVLLALAAHRGLSAGEVEEFLALLTPVLDHSPTTAGVLTGVIVEVRGRGTAVAAVHRALRAAGAVSPADRPGSTERPQFGVIVSHYATAPRRTAQWLSDDVPHLLLEFGDRSIRAGPLVLPGVSACACCLELARTDADACWPALATQLADRVAPTADAVGATVAAGHAVGVLREHLEHAARGSPSPWPRAALRIRGPGIGGGRAPLTELEAVVPHPRCGCRSLPESETAPVRLLA